MELIQQETFGPAAYMYVDGESLQASIWDGFAAGLNHKVPLIIGSNRNETSAFYAAMKAGQKALEEEQERSGNSSSSSNSTSVSPLAEAYPSTAEGFDAMVSRIYGGDAATVLSMLPAESEDERVQAAIEIQTDIMFGGPSYFVAAAMANRSEDAFLYIFDGEAGGPLGSFHSAEIPYVFDSDTFWGPVNNSDLASAMVRYWTDFAKTGSPGNGTSALPAWRPFTMEGGDNATWQFLGPEIKSERIPEDRIVLYNLADALYPDGVLEAVANSPDGGIEGILMGNSNSS